MPQAIRAPGDLLPTVARSSPQDGYYVRQSQQQGGTFVGKRLLGMWVPAEAFRRGTVIKVTGTATAAARSLVMSLSIGRDGSARTSGFLWTTGPAGPGATPSFVLTATQRFDGHIPTFDSSGFWTGAIGLVVTTGTFTPFIQPLNFVELSVDSVTTGNAPLIGCTMEVIPPQYNHRSYQEILDV